jgi:hypothetical protein
MYIVPQSVDFVMCCYVYMFVRFLKLFKTQLRDIKNNVWLLFLYKLNLHYYLNGLVR